MKGLSLRKTSVPRKLREEFTKILTDDILKAEKINLKEVLNKYDALGNTVEESLKDGKTDYVLPKNIESISNYKAPDTIEQIRGLLVWNELEPESQIIPPEKVNIIKLNCFEESDPRLESLKQTHPDKYNKIMKVVFNHGIQNPTIDISRFGLSCIAIPKNIDKIPDYILPFIDYSAMKNNNMANGYIILESLGIYVDAVNTTKYKSNIIEI